MAVRVLMGDCRQMLRTLPAESVHCVVTSPPYFGLRDYGVAGQIGLEPTPAAFVAEMVAVFREVRRVLRDDGTLWLNLGDSYAGSWGAQGHRETPATISRSQIANHPKLTGKIREELLKPKDLIGIPWRVAFALQEDGWYLRQDIIWSKPNPMPESVRDRCTKAHEYVFLLSKSPRYYFDQEPIREDVKPWNDGKMSAPKCDGGSGDRAKNGARDQNFKQYDEIKGANRRSVWTINTSPFPEAHFATFPPELPEICIKAGCPEKCCAKCGAPWVRDIEIESRPNAESLQGKYNGEGVHRTISGGVWNDSRQRTERGTKPSCDCPFEYTTSRGIVLDPFGGAGTTGLVADRLGRDAILIELNPDYAAMAQRRIVSDAPMFAQVSAA